MGRQALSIIVLMEQKHTWALTGIGLRDYKHAKQETHHTPEQLAGVHRGLHS